jgi:hypothetical protein
VQPASTYFKPGTADRLLELLVRHTCPLSLSVALIVLLVSMATIALSPCVSIIIRVCRVCPHCSWACWVPRNKLKRWPWKQQGCESSVLGATHP